MIEEPFNYFNAEIIRIITKLYENGLIKNKPDNKKITIDIPKNPQHGDMASNAAMIIAKTEKQNPKTIAQNITQQLKDNPHINTITIEGPGFINLKLKNQFWQRILENILIQKEKWGVPNDPKIKKTKINVEYVSANPTGPLHIGHCRGAVFGDILANLLAHIGYDVTKEYYINDAGAQIHELAKSVYSRYLEICAENNKQPYTHQNLQYPDPKLKLIAEKIFQKYGNALTKFNETKRLKICEQEAVNENMKNIKKDLNDLNIFHDIFFSEKKLYDNQTIENLIEELKQKNIAYYGKLPPPKGKEDQNWNNPEHLLFKATQFGDEQDRVIKKTNGNYTYLASDIGYLNDKFHRGFHKMIYVLGADHHGYAPRLKAIAAAITDNKAEIKTLFCTLVRFLQNGKPIKMSKREGNFITMRNAIDEIGPDLLRFAIIFRRNDAHLDIDFKKVIEQSKDNPVFYVQYAHARICSVIRAAQEKQIIKSLSNTIQKPNLTLLNRKSEINIIQKLAQYPKMIHNAAILCEPHRIAFYLHELAAIFHGAWNEANANPKNKFIVENNPQLTQARIAMIIAIQYIIQSGLNIMGVKPVEKM